jgi:hypothetical protein
MAKVYQEADRDGWFSHKLIATVWMPRNWIAGEFKSCVLDGDKKLTLLSCGEDATPHEMNVEFRGRWMVWNRRSRLRGLAYEGRNRFRVSRNDTRYRYSGNLPTIATLALQKPGEVNLGPLLFGYSEAAAECDRYSIAVRAESPLPQALRSLPRCREETTQTKLHRFLPEQIGRHRPIGLCCLGSSAHTSLESRQESR